MAFAPNSRRRTRHQSPGGAGPSAGPVAQDRAPSTTQTITTTPPAQLTLSLDLAPRRVRWTPETHDNEHDGGRTSKSCCIYHRPRRFDESGTESSDDGSSSSSSSDESESDGERDADGGESAGVPGRAQRRRHRSRRRRQGDDSDGSSSSDGGQLRSARMPSVPSQVLEGGGGPSCA